MTKNYTILLLFLSLFGLDAYSQKIDLKKGMILVDNVNVFNFEKKNLGSEFYLYQLNDNKNVVYIEINNNNTLSYLEDDFVKIIFKEKDVTIESKSLIDKNWKGIIKLLFTQQVYDKNGVLNEEQLEQFVSKYNNRNL